MQGGRVDIYIYLINGTVGTQGCEWSVAPEAYALIFYILHYTESSFCCRDRINIAILSINFRRKCYCQALCFPFIFKQPFDIEQK